MSRHPNQWPDAAVLWRRPRPTRRTPDGWLRAVADADWLFRHGWDTVDIAEHLRMHERDALRAVVQGREARRSAQPEVRPVHLVSYPVDVEDER
jgi:hypothetical protein